MSVSPSFAGTRALVTGGAGFIGSNLAIALAERGATVRVVDAMIPGYGGNHFNLEPVTGRVAVDVPREVEDDVLAAHVDSLPVAEEAPTNPRGLHEMPLGGALGVRAPFSPERKAQEPGNFYPDVSKIRRILGWRPVIPLRDGLKRTLDFYRANKPRYW